MILEESREVIPLMENMINQIEEQQELIKGTFLRSLLIFMGFSLLSEMEFFAVPKNGISLNI